MGCVALWNGQIKNAGDGRQEFKSIPIGLDHFDKEGRNDRPPNTTGESSEFYSSKYPCGKV